MFSFSNRHKVYTSALALSLALVFVALSASAATTISTNITTNGTLTVDGASTLTGVVAIGSTATSTVAGNFDAAGDIEADQLYTSGTGTSTLSGGLKVRTGGFNIGTLNCSGYASSGLLTTDSSGNVICDDDSTSDGWVDDGITLRLQAVGDHVAMGTTTEADVRSVATLTATSTAGSILTLKTRAVSSGLDYSGSALVITDSASTTLFSIDGKGRIAGFVSSASSTINGALTISGSLNASSSLSVSTDVTVFSGMRIGYDSVGTRITALADDSLFVEGATEIDGITWSDGGVVANASSTVNSTLTVSGVFQASSTALVGNGLRVDGGTLGVATSTPGQEVGIVGDVDISSAATTTVVIDSTDAETGGCIQMRGTDAKWYRIYIVATTTNLAVATRGLYVEPGICQTP